MESHNDDPREEDAKLDKSEQHTGTQGQTKTAVKKKIVKKKISKCTFLIIREKFRKKTR